MIRHLPSRGRPHGFSVVELLVVIAIVVVAVSIAVMLLTAATRTSGMQSSRAAVASALRRAAAAAAKSGETQGLDLWAIPVSSTIRFATESPAPLPESSVVLGSVDLQGGTGYPFSNGSNKAVAIVMSDSADPTTACAVVLGASATVTEYRLVGSTWEVMK